MDKKELYKTAFNQIHHIKLKRFGIAGHVVCALEAINGEIYTGICIDLPCSIGLCAEQSAIAEMLKHGQTAIKQIVAVFEDGNILPPCGRCREFIAQIDEKNMQTKIILPKFQEICLQDLLPERWDKKWA